jgi:hypothetical protein
MNYLKQIIKYDRLILYILLLYINMSHTVEQLRTFKDLNSKQGINKLKSYLKTLKAYKSKLIQGDKEDNLSFEIRKNKMINNPTYLEYSKTEDKGLDAEQLIAKIIQMEKKEHIGDLTKLNNYDLLLEKQKDIGDILWGLNEKGKRQTNTNRQMSLSDKSSIDKALEEYIQLKPLQSESAAAAAEVEKPVEEEVEKVEEVEEVEEVEKVEEVEEVEQPVIRIGKQEEEMTVGADSNTMVDVPEIKKLKQPRVYKVKKGKDLPPAQMFIFDPNVVKGYEEKLLKGDMPKEERISSLKEYRDYLKKGLYKKENENITKRYEEISKDLEDAEKDIQGMVIMGQQETTGSMQAVNIVPEVKKMTTRRAPEEVLEQKEEYEKQYQPTSLSSSSVPKTAYDVLTSGSTKYKVEEAVSYEDIPYGQNDKSIGDVRKIGIGVYDELAKKDDILPSLSQREKSLKRFADFKWITQGGNNNSVLADMSPFQKIDDMEYKLRYGQTFKIKAKIPFDITKRPDLVKKCETKFMMKPDFVPASKIMTVEQPSTPIGFAETAEAASLVRNVLINEKGFDNSKNMEFIPKYEDRPKPSNPFSICTGLQSYYPNEMIEIPVNDPLQKPSIIIHPDTNQIMYV